MDGRTDPNGFHGILHYWSSSVWLLWGPIFTKMAHHSKYCNVEYEHHGQHIHDGDS